MIRYCSSGNRHPNRWFSFKTNLRIGFMWVGLFFVSFGYAQSLSDFKVIRERLEANLLDVPAEADQVGRIVSSLADDGTWPAINYRDTSRTGFEHRIHLRNLLAMAKAYQQQGGAYHHDPQLLAAFRKALNHWLQEDYRCENWWWNEIGVPDTLTNSLFLMQKELNTDELAAGLAITARCNFDGFGARPGGDFVRIAAVKAKTELIRQDTGEFALAIKTMGDQIYIAEKRGIKPDMSFQHRDDGVPSMYYGHQYMSTLAHWANFLRGTRFAFDAPALALVIDYYLDGIQKAMPFGRFDDPGIRNRDVSRRSSPEIPQHDPIADLLAQVSDGYRTDELVHPNLRSNQYFWASHYHSHQRPSYFASVRMHSNRSNNMESPYNEEGLKNHFYADGSQFVTRTGREYLNIYPSWDWRKIPGTTVVQVDTFPHWKALVKKGTKPFVGGVSNGEYGATAFDFLSPHSGLQAHKSWFFFDDEIVCLGAGITSGSPQNVMTTLNQSLAVGPVWVNGKREAGEMEVALHGPGWINHDSIGYVLLDTGQVWLRRGESTGTWRSISHQAPATNQPITQDIFTLAIDHGARPQEVGYAYVILPAKSARETGRYAKHPPITVVSNTSSVQAVSHTGLHIHYAIFYKPGEIVFPGGMRLATDEPALYLIRSSARRIEQVTVADPTRKLSTVTFRIETPAGQSIAQSVDLPQGQFTGKSEVLDGNKLNRTTKKSK